MEMAPARPFFHMEIIWRKPAWGQQRGPQHGGVMAQCSMGLATSPPPASAAGALPVAPRGSGTTLGEPGSEVRGALAVSIFFCSK